MKLETDLEKIRRLAEERDKENWRFRSFLKQCDHEEIDEIVHRLLEEIAPQMDCSTCRNCCMQLHQDFDHDEVERLIVLLGISRDEFEKQYMVKDKYDTPVFKDPPCPFLIDMRCTVDAACPEGCRDYPYLHKEHFTSRLMTVIDNYAICPIVFNVYELLKQEVWLRRKRRR